jgi:hypothetical protein
VENRLDCCDAFELWRGSGGSIFGSSHAFAYRAVARKEHNRQFLCSRALEWWFVESRMGSSPAFDFCVAGVELGGAQHGLFSCFRSLICGNEAVCGDVVASFR